jgi:hypothetical protein
MSCVVLVIGQSRWGQAVRWQAPVHGTPGKSHCAHPFLASEAAARHINTREGHQSAPAAAPVHEALGTGRWWAHPPSAQRAAAQGRDAPRRCREARHRRARPACSSGVTDTLLGGRRNPAARWHAVSAPTWGFRHAAAHSQQPAACRRSPAGLLQPGGCCTHGRPAVGTGSKAHAAWRHGSRQHGLDVRQRCGPLAHTRAGWGGSGCHGSGRSCWAAVHPALVAFMLVVAVDRALHWVYWVHWVGS